MLRDLLDFLKSRVFLLNLLLMILLFFAIIFGVRAYLDHYTLHGKTITVPNVKGGSFQEAKKVLAKRGLNAILKDSINAKGAEPGEVLEQDPEAKEKVKKGRNIYITIRAKGKKRVQMPDLKGHSQRHARSVLKARGLQVKDVEFEPDICKGCVLAQKFNGKSIEPGTRIPRGSKIVLVLGKGKGKKKTEIPDLIGLTIEESKKRLAKATLDLGAVNYEEGCCPTKKDSMNAKVYEQRPAPSEKQHLRTGSTVSISLTSDPNKLDSARTDSSHSPIDTNGSSAP